jgi:hypothetical protein
MLVYELLKAGGWVSALPLNFSEACGLSLFLSGCHFSAAFRYAFFISSCVAEDDIPVEGCQYLLARVHSHQASELDEVGYVRANSPNES